MSKRTAEAIGRTSLRVIKALGKIADASEDLAGVCADLQADIALLPDESPDRDLIATWACTAMRSRAAIDNAMQFLKRSDWLHHLPERTIGGPEIFERADKRATA